jgi:hypothetical protein
VKETCMKEDVPYNQKTNHANEKLSKKAVTVDET